MPTQPSYLEQYLKDLQVNQPDIGSINQRIAAAGQRSQIPDQSDALARGQQIVNAIRPAEATVPRPGYAYMTQGGGIGGRSYSTYTPPQRVETSRQTTAANRGLGQSVVDSFRSQVGAARDQAANYQEALQMRGESAGNYIGQLRGLGETAVRGATESVAAWNRYIDTTDEYVAASRERMATITQDLTNTIDRYSQTNDSALAHSIQTNSHTWLQASKEQERAIAERYGTDSAEYRDWTDSKRASVASMVSDLTARAWDKTQQILNTGLGAIASVVPAVEQSISWAEKNAGDALAAAAAAGDQYRLQTSSYLLSLAAAENTEWSDLADWINNSPVASVDLTPMFAQLLDIQQSMEQEVRAQANEQAGINAA